MLALATNNVNLKLEIVRPLFKFLFLFQCIFLGMLFFNNEFYFFVLDYNWRYEISKALVLLPFYTSTNISRNLSSIVLSSFLLLLSIYSQSTGCTLISFGVLLYYVHDFLIEINQVANKTKLYAPIIGLLLTGLISFKSHLSHEIRSNQIQESIRLLKESNYTGFGIGTWLKYADYDRTIDPFWNNAGVESEDSRMLNHSFYFNLLAESGVLSFVLFLAFIIVLIRYELVSNGLSPEAISILITLVCFLVYLSSFSNEEFYSIIFTILFVNSGIIQNDG